MTGALSGLGQSAAYQDVAGAGETAGGVTLAADYTHRGGYTGQLYEVVGVRFPADPLEVNETSVTSLAPRDVWDDGSTWTPPASGFGWSVFFGSEYATLSPAGVLTTGAVYQNSAVLVRVARPPFTAVLTVVVVDNIFDNFGSYAGDALSDLWQVKNFGLDHPQAGPGADPDADGSDNQSEYFALTDPRDGNSVFSTTLEPDGAGGLRFVFHSVFNRRYWLEASSTLTPDSWTEIDGPLDGAGGPLFFTLPASPDPETQLFRIIMKP